MKKEMEPTTMQTTKEIVNGIWTVGREIYKGVKEEVINSIEDETLMRVRKGLNLKPEDTINLKDSKTKRIYEYEKKQVKKEARELGLRGGLIVFGLGWLF